jgi:CDP-glucose 4,6-dehydratase
MEKRLRALEALGMNLNFWRGRRVFVTGHTGFKGSWLCLWLQSLGAEITGYSLEPDEFTQLFIKGNIASGMQSFVGDISDGPILKKVLIESRPEVVIHMAAQSLVRASYNDPVQTYQTNVIGTVNLLEAIRECKDVKAVVIVTTDKCYENQESIWGYRESDPLGGYDPYSSSKACAELITAAYRNSYFNAIDYGNHGVAIASVRAGNVIGGGDFARDRLVPDVMKSFAKQNPLRVRNPQHVRPWQFVLEPLRGYLQLAERLSSANGFKYANPWNFGPKEEGVQTVEWVVSKLAELWGDEVAVLPAKLIDLHESKLLKLDTSKASTYLQWVPALTLSQSLELVVDWYKKVDRGHSFREITLGQIEDYQRIISMKTGDH